MDNGWACAKAGGGVTCNRGPIAGGLAPNAKFTWTSSVFVPKSLVALCKIDNKIDLVGPPGVSGSASASALVPSKICNQLPLKQTNLKLDKVPLGPCTVGNAISCTYKITLTNTFANEYKGPVALNDVPNAGGTITSIIASDPKFKCSGLLTGSCFWTDAIIPAGAAKEFEVTVKSPLAAGPAQGCKLTNTANLTVPAPGPDNTIPADDHAKGTAVLTPDQCKPLTNLKLVKKSMGDCKLAGDNWECWYSLTVTNTGLGTYKGKVVIHDGFPASSPLFPAFCKAAGPNQQVCTLDVNLPPNGSTSFNARLDIPNAQLAETGMCKIMNVATIASPLGTPDNSSNTDDGDIAIAKIPMIPVKGKNGQIHQVPCDPPSLAIEKTADPRLCAKTSGGHDCTYKVTVRSLGPDALFGSVQVDEIAPAGTTLKSISAPWTCQINGASAKCAYPETAYPASPGGGFAVGTSIDMKVAVFVPDTYIRTASCTIVNRVETTIPAEVLHGAESAHAQASAQAMIDDPACKPPQTAICPDGWGEVGNAGRLPRTWDVKTVIAGDRMLSCARPAPEKTEEKPVCRDGWSQVANPKRLPGAWIVENVTAGGTTIACAKPGRENDTGKDEGPVTTPLPVPQEHPRLPPVVEKRPPVVEKSCGANEHRTAWGACVCDEDFHRGRANRCVPDAVVRICPDGMTGTPPNCRPVRPRTAPVCPRGTYGEPPFCEPLNRPERPREPSTEQAPNCPHGVCNGGSQEPSHRRTYPR
jgi:hypothetical protein